MDPVVSCYERVLLFPVHWWLRCVRVCCVGVPLASLVTILDKMNSVNATEVRYKEIATLMTQNIGGPWTAFLFDKAENAKKGTDLNDMVTGLCAKLKALEGKVVLETTQHADTSAQKPSGSYTKHNESTGKSSLLCGCCGRRGHAEQNCFYAPGGKFADRPNPKDRPQKTYPKQTGKVASMEQLHDEVAGLKQKLAAFTSGAPAPPQQQYTRQ